MQELYFVIVIPYGERRINRNWRTFCFSARVVTYQTSRSRSHKRIVMRVGQTTLIFRLEATFQAIGLRYGPAARTSASLSPSCDPSVQSTEDQCPEAWNSLHSACVSPALWPLVSKPNFAASSAPRSACSLTLRMLPGRS